MDKNFPIGIAGFRDPPTFAFRFWKERGDGVDGLEE
jgi:hypothetical protein